MEVRLGVAKSSRRVGLAEDNLLHEFSANSQLLTDVKAGHPRPGRDTAALPPPQLPWVSGYSRWVWLQKPNPSIFPSCCSQEGDLPSKGVLQFCMKGQEVSSGEQLGKFFRTNVMHIRQDRIPLSGSAA